MKQIFAALFGGVAAAVSSLHATFFIMLVMFLMDFVFGIIAGWIINGEGFRWKKGLVAFSALMVYASITALMSVIGRLLDDIETGRYAVKAITYIYVYIIGTNILRNLSRIFIGNKLFIALYWLISFEFAKKFPTLHKKISDEEGN